LREYLGHPQGETVAPLQKLNLHDAVLARIYNVDINTLRVKRVAEVILESPHLIGSPPHDAHTAILMREHGIRRICTRDTDFNQFTFLEGIDPLRS
jgi:predicted nucleic acid-binding protein